MIQNCERQISGGEYRNNYRGEGRDRNRSRERSFSRNFSNDRNNRGTSNPYQDQGQAQIETESDVASVGKMIILQGTVLPPEKKEN